MDTVASLQCQLDALNAARAKGALSVEYVANGVSRRVQWKSDREQNAAAQDLMRRISALSGTSPDRTVKIASSKGLYGRRDFSRGWDGSNLD
jgi:hypothetical protein